jgi:hypothetical protein
LLKLGFFPCTWFQRHVRRTYCMEPWNREELIATYGCALVEFEKQPVKGQDLKKKLPIFLEGFIECTSKTFVKKN